jgi:hypothetical protein
MTNESSYGVNTECTVAVGLGEAKPEAAQVGHLSVSVLLYKCAITTSSRSFSVVLLLCLVFCIKYPDTLRCSQ